jgi:hypothetical protein
LPWDTKLTREQAAKLGATVANVECEKQYHKRPFKPDTFPAKFKNNYWWHWGRLDQAGVDGFSAEVSFNATGDEQQVKVYLSTDTIMPKKAPASIDR